MEDIENDWDDNQTAEEIWETAPNDVKQHTLFEVGLPTSLSTSKWIDLNDNQREIIEDHLYS